MKLLNIANELIEIVKDKGGRLLPFFNNDFKEAIDEAELMERKAKAFDWICKQEAYIYDENVNCIRANLAAVEAAMKKEIK